MKRMNKYRLKIAIDVDDVLLPCVPLAVSLANKEPEFINEPMTLEEITGWGPTGKRTDIILKYFKEPDFYKNQIPYEGSQDFIKELSKIAEVFICTAVPFNIMGIRGEQLMKYFPEIPADHIVMGSRKDLLNVDVILDDNPNHILQSNAAFPVLMRRPWNYHITGILGVAAYDEFIRLIKEIKNSYVEENELISGGPFIVALVGPSGSGKNEVAKKLEEEGDFVKLKSYTTKIARSKEEDNLYHYLSEKHFLEMKYKQEFLETSIYANSYFGTKENDINDILSTGKNIVIPIDIAGAIALKSKYDSCITIFLRKSKEEIIRSILKDKYSDDERVNRLLSLNAEFKNEEICNYSINNISLNDTIASIKNILHLR